MSASGKDQGNCGSRGMIERYEEGDDGSQVRE